MLNKEIALDYLKDEVEGLEGSVVELVDGLEEMCRYSDELIEMVEKLEDEVSDLQYLNQVQKVNETRLKSDLDTIDKEGGRTRRQLEKIPSWVKRLFGAA